VPTSPISPPGAVGGQVEVSDAKTPKRRNKPADWVVIRDAHEPLIDADLFERVQRRFALNRGYTTLNAKKDFALTGLLVCGNCGWKLIGTRRNRNSTFSNHLLQHGP
jgi:hypothetical protein